MFEIKKHISPEQLQEFCRNNHIIKLSLFGSALRDELGPDSDIDLLVEFAKGNVPGLLELVDMEIELSEMLGRKVDLRTPDELSRFFRDDVLKKAWVEYAL